MQKTAAQHRSGNSVRFAHPKRNVAAFGLQHGMRVVDFGAGSGAYTLAIAERLQGGGTVFAVDIQRDLLRRILHESSKRGLKNVEILWADLEAPRSSKLANDSIDLILISNLLFQVPDKVQVLREARRIVKGAGHVIIIDWSESFGGMGPIDEDVFTKSTALAFAKKEGFELMREFEAGAHHYGLVLRPTVT